MNRKLYALCGADRSRPFSPHVWKTALSLAHKGLDYETLPVGFTEIPTIENGATKMVPLLRDGDTLISDSFDIAVYLEKTYPDRPSLFGGPGGQAMARFIESWSQLTLHTALVKVVVLDIHDRLAPVDQAYFRSSREARFGTTLEAVVEKNAQAELAAFAARLEPIRATLKRQPFIGGETPLFSDYILFGPLQWARITSPMAILAAGDPVTDWFERCLDLYDGIGRSVTAA
ncbi:MAG TPA: glutathione S-transferase family protein [Pararhizobium sp.]|uniref:glutathione S-transferase family protein n=1 Tax=Pararhizobium sp. TaxID=1977563 RepID=UPI002C088E8A|nr:glutathione S-transferase family protein [Pararhizobium sp.]HTO30231.1 glutathione S-transferase family protein [Pararhizobium sp.]